MLKKYLSTCLFLVVITFMISCASLQQPQGGPRDTEAPKVVEEFPKNLSKNFKGRKIEITFDEFFKLTSEFTEITVSPETEVPPNFKIRQKTLEISFKDSLDENTTYSINFGKAIQDVNESNVLKNYSFVFATGPKLDSLTISGQVISSVDNKPILDATVLLFPLDKDTLFGKKRPSIYTATDSSGNFNLKNLREDSYQIYAIKETSGDRIYNSPDEDIAFINKPIKLTKDTSNIILKLFKQEPDKFRIVDRKIENDGKISIYFNQKLENPSISFIGNTIPEKPIVNFTPLGDTAQIYLKTLTFDSLKVIVTNNDTVLDTVTFRRSQKDTYERTILFNNNLSGGKIIPGRNLQITFNQPIEQLNQNQIEIIEDTIPKQTFIIKKVGNSSFTYQIDYPWKVKKRYSLQFKEGSVNDIYGTEIKAIKLEFELDEVENYGNLSLNITKADSSKNYILQLLTEKNSLYKEFLVKKDEIFNINNIPINKFKVKVIEDANNNGKFDSGNVYQKIQPEKCWIWDQEIITRANWDREEKIEIPKEFE
jgi:hypothetical protein